MAESALTVDAALALPQPDTARLGAAVRSLHPVATRATEPMTAAAPSTWWGGARGDAVAEVAWMRTIAAELGVRAEAARLAVAAYLSAVVNTRGIVLGLRGQWMRGEHRLRGELERLSRIERLQQLQAPLTGGPLLDIPAQERLVEAEWGRLRAELQTRHGTAVRALEAEQARCVAVLRACLAGLPGNDPASTRKAIIDQLPISGSAVRTDEAKRIVADLVHRAGVPPGVWTQRQAPLLAELAGRIDDPYLAREVMRLLGPDTLVNLTERLVSAANTPDRTDPQLPQVQAALRVLGAGLVTAADPRHDDPSDLDLAAVQSWRRQWLAALATLVDQPAGTREHVPPFVGSHAIGALLRAGREALPSRSPGRDFATTVGVAMIRDDVRTGRYAQAHDNIHSPTACGIDPVAQLLSSVDGDVAAARELLLFRLDADRRVIDHLVTDRITRAHSGGNESVAPLARLIRQATAGADPEAVQLAGQLLAALARTAAVWRENPLARGSLDSQLDPLRGEAGRILATNLDLLWKLTERPGPDPAVVTVGDHGLRVNVSSRRALADLLTQVALDGVVPGRTHVQPTDAPAYRALLEALLTHHGTDLAAALRSGNAAAKDSAARRFGMALGLTLTCGFRGLASANATVDESNRRTQDVVNRGVDLLRIPSKVKAGLPGVVLGFALDKALDLAKEHVKEAVVKANPSDNQDRTQQAQRASDGETTEKMTQLAWDLAGAAGSWPPGKGPLDWGRTHPQRPVFWGPDGHPLPYDQLTGPGQRDAFDDWRRDLPDFTALPDQLRRAVEQGVKASP